jgi:CheY-like chemotaxis protein
MRKCLEITFSGTEFELVTVDSAESALEKVKTLSPSLVIADVSLPPHDGYELCSTIKLAAPNLPVLMLSSKQNPFDPTKGAQADGHVDKPFDTQVLQDKARELVVKSDHAAEEAPPAFGDAARVRAAVKPVAMPERAPSSKIPAPRRKRPTPAMMSKPETPPKPVQPQPPAAAAQQVRRTVPFAMPGAAKRTVPGGSGLDRGTGLDRTIPMPGGRDAAAANRGAITPPLGPSMGVPSNSSIGTTPRPAVTQQSFGAADAAPAATPANVVRADGFGAPSPTPLAGTSAGPGKVDLRPRTALSDTLPGVSTAADVEEAPPTPALPMPTPLAVAEPVAPVAPAGPEVELPPAAAADLHGKLETLGLTKAQIEGVLALSRELIEQVVWEVVPVLAETLIKEEIRRLTKD